MDVFTRFIIIDDDEFNNKICTVNISKIAKDADIRTFLDAHDGFNFISTEYSKPGNDASAILFLDLNMPGMNGWEFLEKFNKLDEDLKTRIKINILSSSVDKRDIQKAKENKNVKHYLIKPLTKETIRLITYSQNREA